MNASETRWNEANLFKLHSAYALSSSNMASEMIPAERPSWLTELSEGVSIIKKEIAAINLKQSEIVTSLDAYKVSTNKAILDVNEKCDKKDTIIKEQGQQLSKLIDVTVRQQQEIDECKQELDKLYNQNNKRSLCIQGIVPTAGMSDIAAIQDFFRNILKINELILLRSVHVTGQRDKKPHI